MNRYRLAASVGCAVASFSAYPLQAQNFPTRPMRLMVGFAPGGATDIAARVLAGRVSETFGQSMIVENRPGAAGNLAAELVVKSPADGYTLYLANATIAIPSLFKRLTFDVKKDLAPVTLIGLGPSLLAVHPSLPARTVSEVIALAKKRPGQLNFASGGNGNITHLAMELLISMTGINMVHIPYKGGAPSTVAVVSGESDLMFSSIASTLPHLETGRLRGIAVSSGRRSVALPKLPTVAEAGITDYEASSWYAIMAPAATPKAVIGRLAEEMVKALAEQGMKDKLAQQGIEPADTGPVEFARYLDNEMVKWAKVVKSRGITAD
jgi:tripartite-type tricarboxylate transporter receptor subunit TctC